jgi:hypothetical protein
MKNLFISLFLALFMSLGASAQQFSLETLTIPSEYGWTGGLFVVDEEILGACSSGPVYYDGSIWYWIGNQPVTQGVGKISGIKKANGEIFAVHSLYQKSFIWNKSIKNWDYFMSPASANSTFVLSETEIFISTSKRPEANGNSAALYLWNGQTGIENFVEIANKVDYSLGAIYAKNLNDVLLLGTKSLENSGVVESKLFRYNGVSIVDVYSFDIDDGFGAYICSNDGQIFFITTDEGDVYKFDDLNQQMTKVYSRLEGTWGAKRTVVIDNDNIFVSNTVIGEGNGDAGFFHVKVSTGQKTRVQAFYPGYEQTYGYFDVGIIDGYFDKYSGFAYFTGFYNSEIMFMRLKVGSLSGISGPDISSETSLYPNPASDNIVLQLPQSPKITGEGKVYNVIGAEVLSFNINSDKKEINISALSEGMYIVKMRTSQGIASKKFIKR